VLTDLAYLRDHAWLLAGALLGLLVFKGLLNASAVALFRIPWSLALPIGLALAPLSEFSFVGGQAAVQTGLITPASYQFLLVLGILSMACTPFLLSLGDWWERIRRQGAGASGPGKPIQEGGVRAILVGYGPVGQALLDPLKEAGATVTVIELNLKTVKRLEKGPFQALYGDATRREVLKAGGLERATHLLVTLPDLPSRFAVIATARLLNPSLKVFCRARYEGEVPLMKEAGADEVVCEETEAGRKMAGLLRQEFNLSKV
jgi:hypothetical protein